MERSALLFRLCVVMTSLGALICVVFAWWAEFGATQVKNRGAVEWYLSETGLDTRGVGSLEGQFSVILGCDRALNDPIGAMVPGESRLRVASQCEAAMGAFLDKAPSFSAAHLIRANALVRMGEPARAREALEHSERWGRGLQWMAVRRLSTALSLGIGPDIAPEGDMVERDLARLLTNKRDARFVAGLHAQYPDLQDALVSRVERLAPEMQQAFLRAVRERGLP